MLGYILSILQHILFFALRIEKNSFPRPLTKEEQDQCFRKIKNKDKTAIDMLINHNLRLVAHIVKKYYSSSNDQDDLISIGTIGLIKAVKNYDAEKKIKFATYASRCIENEILMYFRQIKRNFSGVVFNLDSSSKGNENINFNLNNFIEETDVLDIVDLRCKSKELYCFMDRFLTKREKKVLVYRYGLYGMIPLTQQETSKKLNISRSYVSRIEKKAIEKLAKEFKKIY